MRSFAVPSLMTSHVDRLLAISSASVYCKDKNDSYLECNQSFMNVSGLSKEVDIKQLTDNDLVWKQYANIMVKNDHFIKEQKINKLFIEPSILITGEYVDCLSYKSPIVSASNKIIGIFGLSYILDKQSLQEDRLHEISLLLGFEASDQVRKVLYQKKAKKLGLTPRQSECVYFLSKGMTYKMIANQLNLSVRTVETYVLQIMNKLQVDSKSQLMNFFHSWR